MVKKAVGLERNMIGRSSRDHLFLSVAANVLDCLAILLAGTRDLFVNGSPTGRRRRGSSNFPATVVRRPCNLPLEFSAYGLRPSMPKFLATTIQTGSRLHPSLMKGTRAKCFRTAQMLLKGVSSSAAAAYLSSTLPLSWRPRPLPFIRNPMLVTFSFPSLSPRSLSACSSSESPDDLSPAEHSKTAPLKPGLYLVGTPIGNLEDITFRALRVLRSANVILSEDTRHSGRLLQYYDIKTPLLSYHKFNESQRERTVLKRLKEGEIVALISDAGTPGISDPGTEMAKLCAKENIPVIPIPGPCAVVAALSASGLNTEQFTFVGFLPKHSGMRREKLLISASQATTQIFYVPPHKLLQFLEEACSIFGDSRRCVIAREITKIHEEFWRGTVGEAKEAFLVRQPRGEITVLIEGKTNCEEEAPSDAQLEKELKCLISSGHSLSAAVKMVSEATSVRKKTVYTLALQKFGNQLEEEDDTIDR